MKLAINEYKALTITVALALVLCCLVKKSSQLPDQKKARTETCGSSNELAGKIETCAKPVMDIIEGNLKKWPKTLNDTEAICEEIYQSERCIRDENRRCAQGLQRAIVSTVANSVTKARKRECSKTNHPAVLRMINCIEKHSKDTKKLIAHHVTLMGVVETQMKNLDQRNNGVCCTAKSLEEDLRTLFDRICPEDTQLMIRLYKTVMDETLDLICRSAKCQGDTFRGFVIPKSLNYDNGKLVATTLRIIFSLDG